MLLLSLINSCYYHFTTTIISPKINFVYLFIIICFVLFYLYILLLGLYIRIIYYLLGLYMYLSIYLYFDIFIYFLCALV